MEKEFATEDIRSVFSKIMQFMDDSDSEFDPPASTLSKTQSIIIKKEPEDQKPVKKISINQFSTTTLARMQAKQNAVNAKIKQNAKIAEEKLNQTMKSVPIINKKYKMNIKPISQRYEEVIETKKGKINELTQKLNKEKNDLIDKELTFHPKTIDSERPVRDFEEIICNMKEWEEKKNLKVLLKKEEIEEKINEKLTFKPNLCENSVKIISELGDQKDFGSRLFESKKSTITPEPYTFAPRLSEKTKKLTKNRSETKVFSRLYTSHKDLLALLNAQDYNDHNK
jgi:hypothetical protein